MRSIIQREDDRRCYLCEAQGMLETHHCIKGSNRKIADREGLTVYLCPACHRLLHDTGRDEKKLMQIAEAVWMAVNSKTKDDFRMLFGKNYI